MTQHFLGGDSNKPAILSGSGQLRLNEQHERDVLVHYRVTRGERLGHEGIAYRLPHGIDFADVEVFDLIHVPRGKFRVSRGDIESWEHIGSRKVRRK
jgi:hypothetical protein